MDDRYYSEWDRWFTEEHDGTEVLWKVCDVVVPEVDCDHVTLCATRGPGGDVEHSVTIEGEIHTVRHEFMASSSLEAMQKYYDKMGFGTYKPHPGWDEAEGRWRG